MNRFRVTSKDGTTNENTVYYLSGPGSENKRPNIISRPKTKPGSSVTVQSPQQQQQATEEEFVQVSTAEAMDVSDANNVVTEGETVPVSEGENPVCLPIQILDEAATAEFIRASNAGGNHQIIPEGAMTIETDDGNLMVFLQNDDDDETTTTGTIAFGHDMSEAETQIIQNVQFSSEGGTIEIPNMEFGGDNEIPETTSYILVQMDDQGNNFLVPASAFSSQVNGIPTLTQVPTRSTQQQHYSGQFIRSPQPNYNPESGVQEKGKPFRYVLPESEESKIEEGSQYILNVLPGPSHSVSNYPQPQRQVAAPKAKAPPKPRKPRPKKGDVQPGSASAPSTSQPGAGKGKGRVVVVSQAPSTATTNTTGTKLQQTPGSTLRVMPGGTVVRVTPVGTGVGGQPATGSTAQVEPKTNTVSSDQPGGSSADESEQFSAGADEGSASSETGAIVDSAISAALGMVVSTAVGPVVPIVTEVASSVVAGPGVTKPISAVKPLVAAAGPSKQNVIVVTPATSSAKDSANAVKKPTEEIVVTAFGTFKCTFCFKESTVRSHLVNHINRIHKGEKPFKCKICNTGFQYSSSLKVHEKNHTVEKPFKCDFCDCAFATDSNRNLHQKTVHSVPKDSMALNISAAPKLKFECATCKKAYCSKYNLLCHRLTHVDDFTKPIVCDFCKKECKTKAMLVNHVQTHKDAVGPFTCSNCDMSFTTEMRLEVHRQMHKEKRKIYVKVEPVVENRQVPKVNLAGRRNIKVSTPTPRKKKGVPPATTKEVFCSICEDIFPNAAALELHKQKKHAAAAGAKSSKVASDAPIRGRRGIKTGPKAVLAAKKKSQAVATATKPGTVTEGVVKRGPGRPKKSETPVATATATVSARGRPPRVPATKELKKPSPTRKPVKTVGRGKTQKRRGRPPKKKETSPSPDESSEEEEEPTTSKKAVPAKETSPKEKLTKPIKKRPIRTDAVSEPEPSSREASPPPGNADDLNRRKSERKRGKNPYLEELKKNREKKIKARKQKAKESLKRGAPKEKDDGSPTPAKRKRMASSPKKEEKATTPSPKKEEDDTKPLTGSSRGGRKRKVTDVVIAAAIPKKRPYPKEIQDLIAASNESSANPEPSSKLIPEAEVVSNPTEPNTKGAVVESNLLEGSAGDVAIPANTLKSEESELNESSTPASSSDPLPEGNSENKSPTEETAEAEQQLSVETEAEAEAGPSKSAEDSGPATSTSSGEGQEQDDEERINTSVPMKKRKVIKTERERDSKSVDKDEVGKSFFQIFKQVKKDYVSSA